MKLIVMVVMKKKIGKYVPAQDVENGEKVVKGKKDILNAYYVQKNYRNKISQ